MINNEFNIVKNSKLHKIQSIINSFLEDQNCDSLCRSTKQPTLQLIYLFKFIRLFVQKTPKLQNRLKTFMQKLLSVLKSTQYQEYGQKLPFLWYLISKYGFQNLQNVQEQIPDKGPLRKAITDTLHYKGLDSIPNDFDQLGINKDQKLNLFLISLSNNQIILQNNQCICCSEVLICNFPILNINPIFKVIMTISPKKAFIKDGLQKSIASVCNSGGGILFIGASRKKGFVLSSGIKFASEESIKEKQNKILNAIKITTPQCRYKVERVLVHTNYIANGNIAKQFMRICFRVLLFPNSNNKTTFLKIPRKGCELNYQTYTEDQLKPVKAEGERIYDYIHQQYKREQVDKASTHKNIICMKPYLYYSKIFNEAYSDGSFDKEDMLSCYESDEQQSDIEFFDQPRFSYLNTSLIIVASQNYQKSINNFLSYLKIQKYMNNYESSKLYPQSFPGSQRCVWYISHDFSYNELKNLLSEYIHQKSIKVQVITIMPAYTTLQIQSSKLTKKVQNLLDFRMFARFNRGTLSYSRKITEILDKKNKQKKKVTYLKFQNLVLSLHAYMIFEEIQLRPYFISNQQTLK